MNILITGVAGFIGSKLSSYLLKNNHNVYGVDNLWKGKFKNIPNVNYKENIEEAIKSINLKQGDLLLITGSLYLCSEVLNLN